MTDDHKYTGADIQALKKKAQESGLSYNEAIAFIARTTGGRGTDIYSDTNPEVVKKQNQQSENME